MNDHTRWIVQAIVENSPEALVANVPRDAWYRLLVRALQNRSLYRIALCLLECDESTGLPEEVRAALAQVVDQARLVTGRHNRISRRISQILDEMQALGIVFKTYRPFPHVPSDVDVLVESTALNELSEILVNEDFALERHYDFPLLETRNEISALAPDGTKVDLHTEYAKEGRTIFSAEMALATRILRDAGDHQIWQTSDTVEMLALLSNIMLERKHVSLSDLLYFDHLCGAEADVPVARSEAVRNGWGDEFDYALSLVNGLLPSIGREPRRFENMDGVPTAAGPFSELPHLLGFEEVLQIARRTVRCHPPTAILSVLYWLYADLRRRARRGDIIGMDATWFDRRELEHLRP